MKAQRNVFKGDFWWRIRDLGFDEYLMKNCNLMILWMMKNELRNRK